MHVLSVLSPSVQSLCSKKKRLAAVGERSQGHAQSVFSDLFLILVPVPARKEVCGRSKTFCEHVFGVSGLAFSSL